MRCDYLPSWLMGYWFTTLHVEEENLLGDFVRNDTLKIYIGIINEVRSLSREVCFVTLTSSFSRQQFKEIIAQYKIH